jgi:lichenan operon transcriptional antiterminator
MDELTNKLTERQWALLKAIQQCGGKASGKTLSGRLNLSLRTVQSEMRILKTDGYISSDPEGYRISSHAATLISTPVKNGGDADQIIHALLYSDSPVSIYDLCDEFALSESALNVRLTHIQNYVRKDRLKLIRKGSLVSIEGSELNKRRMIRGLIIDNVKENANGIACYQRYFPGIDVDVVQNIIVSSIQDAGFYIQAPYASSLYLSILIFLYRILHNIHTPDLNNPIDTASVEYMLAQTIVKRFGQHYTISYTGNDASYLASLFQGQISQSAGQKPLKIDVIEKRVTELLTEILEERFVPVDVSPFIHNLSLHIYELIHRCQTHNVVLSNSYVSLKESSPFIYDVAVAFAKELEKEYSIQIPDDEIAFLAVHIGLIIASQNADKSSPVSILLFASNYHGIAEMIRQRMIESYQDRITVEIADILSSSSIFSIYDLIISTTHLSVIGGNVIEISPFYSVMDRTRVDEAITACLKRKEASRWKRDIMNAFAPDLFFIRDDIDTSTEAIRFLCDRMIRFGAVDENYTESVLERESLSPTCFFNEFAIPHALEMNAKKTMFAILINKNGIQWSSSKVQLCMMIAITKEDSKVFSDTYNGAVHVLTDFSKFTKLINSKTFAEFILNFMQD